MALGQRSEEWLPLAILAANPAGRGGGFPGQTCRGSHLDVVPRFRARFALLAILDEVARRIAQRPGVAPIILEFRGNGRMIGCSVRPAPISLLRSWLMNIVLSLRAISMIARVAAVGGILLAGAVDRAVAFVLITAQEAGGLTRCYRSSSPTWSARGDPWTDGVGGGSGAGRRRGQVAAAPVAEV